MDLWIEFYFALSDKWAVGVMGCRSNGLSEWICDWFHILFSEMFVVSGCVVGDGHDDVLIIHGIREYTSKFGIYWISEYLPTSVYQFIVVNSRSIQFDFHVLFLFFVFVLRIVVSNTYCAVFFFVLCNLCWQFLWIVHVLLTLRYSLTFIYPSTLMANIYMVFVSIHRNFEFTEYLNTCQGQFTNLLS
jgi:hypothetical protein